ncbi:MAG: hypothetical protein Q9207_003427 [Kuettlingeria erythrocarpa]
MPLKLKPPSLPNQPPPDNPTSATSAKRKLTLTFGGASQSTPTTADPPTSIPAFKKPKAPRKPKVDKPARTPKPTTKKREFEASALADADDDAPKENSLANVKRLKLSISGLSKPRPPTPPKEDEFNPGKIKYVRTKFKGKIPVRPVGVGYDSGSSDVENDPALEEEFILRMVPGEDCDYIRQAVIDKAWGSAKEGGADVRMQFLREDGRRAVISVQKRLYAACLVDLPCVIEGMKSWDKKAWFKTADICQMLMVLGRVTKEEDAMDYPLPKDVDPKTWQYAHGLTPPMRYARKRRFRKRISKTTIEAVEEEVERLLREDAECENDKGESRYEIIDQNRLTQEQHEAEAEAEEYDEDEDAEGVDEEDAEGDEDIENAFEPIDGNEPEDEDADAEMEAALAKVLEMDDEDPEPNTLDTTATTPQPTQTFISDSPAAETPSQPIISDSSAAATPAKPTDDTGDSDAASSDEDDQASELDEETLEEKRERERQWEEINDMKVMIKGQEEKAAAQPNAILKGKILTAVRSLKRDLGVKLAALGVEEEGEDA